MDNIFEIVKIIRIGIAVATFLFNTGRIINAIRIFKDCLVLLNGTCLETVKAVKEATIPIVIYVYGKFLEGCNLLYDHTSVLECGKELQVTLHKFGQKEREGKLLLELGRLRDQRCEYEEAKQLYKKALSILIETGNNYGVGTCYGNLGNVCTCLSQYTEAEEYLQKALTIMKEIGDKKGEATNYGNLGNVFRFVGEYTKAEEYLKKALKINKEIGDKQGEASNCGNLGTVFLSVGQYTKAEEYLQKALTMSKEIGDKDGEASDYGDLGSIFFRTGQYTEAEEYFKKALTIYEEIGDKLGQATYYGSLGSVYQSLGQRTKAREYVQKALTINEEIGNKAGQATSYGKLGAMASFVISQSTKAEEYLKKALTINEEIGNKDGQARCYANLGSVFLSVGQHTKAEEYLNKALMISQEIGDKDLEGKNYANLGVMFQKIHQYGQAEEYLQQALTIHEELGDKAGQALCYHRLGGMFLAVGQMGRAEECIQRALTTWEEIGDKEGEASGYNDVGVLFTSFGEYTKAEEYLQKALRIWKEIGDENGEASVYDSLGCVFISVGQYTKAEEYFQKALNIKTKIGTKAGVGGIYLMLGRVSLEFKQYAASEEFAKKALEISYETEDMELQFISHLNMAINTVLTKGSIDKAAQNFFESIQKVEEMHDILRVKEELKIPFFDKRVTTYLHLCRLLIASDRYYEALYVAELGRSRALADTLSDKYSVDKEISINPKSWIGIENITNKNPFSSFVYLSCYHDCVYFWILRLNKAMVFRQTKLKESADKVFGNLTFGGLQNLRQLKYEDRSLFSSYVSSLTTCKPSQDERSAALGPIQEENDESQDSEPPILADFYNMIVAPVAHLLQEPEIIIVPFSLLYPIPFAALKDDNGKYLSDTFRIRIVPSLTTLKLIQHSPAHYHSNTGALIVGEPEVSDVSYKGKLQHLDPLPWARKEAQMIGLLLGVQPLLGKNATKQAVLESMKSVSLIHFAAHGDAERGEIALSPKLSCGIPHEEDYLLTMAEISQVRLTAKLVVLSCCHSASGQIRAEGVVGIARAFLASGARAVLAALWPLYDEATTQFMDRFYKHLIHGESASESLHLTMKWMRENHFSGVRHWAPFTLIGDDVSFKGLYLIFFV